MGNSFILRHKLVFFISLAILACLALGIGSVCLAVRQFSQPEPTQTSIPVHYYPVDTQVEIYYEMGLDGRSGDDPYEEIKSIDWQPKGTLIAIANNHLVYLYNVTDGSIRELLVISNHQHTVSWSSDGGRLAGDDHAFWIWDAVTDTVQYSPELRDEYDSYDCVLWSPDARFIMGCSRKFLSPEQTLRMWDTIAGSMEQYSVQGMDEVAFVLDWSPDGQYLAVPFSDDSSYSIRTIDFQSRDVAHILSGEAVSPASWSPDGSLLASCHKEGGVIIWDTSIWQPVTTLMGVQGGISPVKWHPNGEYLATVSDDGVRIWNVETGNSNIVQTERVLTLDWNSDGSRLVTAVNNEIYIWDTTQLP